MSDYWDTVESIAREVIEQNGTDEQNWHDSITKQVDGNHFIIYTAENETVLNESDNEPDGREVTAMAGEDADWRKMRTIAAYMAMEADVWEKCRELVEEYEPDHFMLKKADGSFVAWNEFDETTENYQDSSEEAEFADKSDAESAIEDLLTQLQDGVTVVAFNSNNNEIPIVDD
jgi:uncharacterized protein YheU (UPF0270 family)